MKWIGYDKFKGIDFQEFLARDKLQDTNLHQVKKSLQDHLLKQKQN